MVINPIVNFLALLYDLDRHTGRILLLLLLFENRQNYGRSRPLKQLIKSVSPGEKSLEKRCTRLLRLEILT